MKKYGKEIPFVRNLPFCAMSFSTQTMDFRVHKYGPMYGNSATPSPENTAPT